MADYLLDTNILSLWYDTSKSENSRVVAPVNAVRQLLIRQPTTCLVFLSPSSPLVSWSMGLAYHIFPTQLSKPSTRPWMLQRSGSCANNALSGWR